MVTGIALLGTLAGSLASFFRVDEDQSSTPSEPQEPTAPNDPTLQTILSELSALRGQVDALTEMWAHCMRGIADEQNAVIVPATDVNVSIGGENKLFEIVNSDE